MNLPEGQVHDVGVLTRPDQWTLTQGRQMPAFKFRVDDMEPWAWTRREGLQVSGNSLSGGPLNLSEFAVIDPATWERLAGRGTIKEVEYVRIQDDPYYVVRQAADQCTAVQRGERLHEPYAVTGRIVSERLLVNARTLEVRNEAFTVESLVNRLKAAVPDVPIVEAALLPDYDSYYYSRGRQTPLPVVRVKFADPDRTWVYIDPENSQLLASVHRFSRIERWLFNGLHSLDFSFWYNKRPLWDVGMIVLSLGGIASSGIGLWIGIKRIRRNVKRAIRSWFGDPAGRASSIETTLDQNSDRPLLVQDMRITPELFPLLGLKVVLGRPLAPDDAIDANPDVAVIGHDLWLTRFGGTPDVLGKSFELRRGRTVTVVGVAAAGSDVPENWISFPIVWHPIRVSERAAPNQRFTVLARLKAGRPISAVNAEITARRPLTDSNSGANRPVDVKLLLDHVVGDSQRVLWVFFGAMACVLLIGVANLVSLQLVRNAGRERELGLRAALGASRWRLIRQLLVESLLLGAVGGAGGLLAASNVVALVTSALPADFPRADQIALDGAVWVFAALVSALVGVTIGVIPALRSIQPGLMQRMNEGGGSATLSHRRARIQRGLIAFETAAALVLLVGAGLLVNSFGRLISEDAGMRERGLWVVRGTLPMRYRAPADTEFWLSALRHLRELPEVEGAALVVNDSGPLGGHDNSRGGIVPEGQTGGQGRGFSLSHRGVGGGYFTTLGIPIVSGRPILDSDTDRNDGVVVLNRAAAAALWPGEDPLGKRLGGFGRRLTVVGIVPNFKLTRLDGEVSLQMYTSMLQQPMGAETSTIMLRAKPGARAITDRTKAILVNLDKDVSHIDVLTMAQVRWKLLASERFRSAIARSD
jgi:putative ABC transport system permease protein